jgi:Flp pilus assembly protein TadG
VFGLTNIMPRISKSKRRRGSELIEFTWVFLPLLVIVFATVDVAWTIFAKSTLAYAVRAGLRVGITMTGTKANGTDLTTLVKQSVQANASGFLGKLSTDARWQNIKVHYYDGGTLADVSTSPGGNKPGNIITVSIEGYTLNPLVARLWGWNQSPDKSAAGVGDIAVDRIEPSTDLPAIGVAP